MREIRTLDRTHDRVRFDCGEPALNRYLQQTARQHNDKGISKTFVYVDSEYPEKIIAFFTLSICEIVTQDLPQKYSKKLPQNAPAAKLARLAVAKPYQGQRVGTILLVEAIQRTLVIAENFGIVGFFVDAKNERAKQFYVGFGFIEVQAQPLVLFLPLATLLAAHCVD
ncbi:MAG: GNAT family N-acetyltransferase [Deltaproteobacteria bacterium]|nr:GNAT family N-acetyltransferase [Deltaproteobacteria bacterium]